jgi:superfamily II DNA or RNA helicase
MEFQHGLAFLDSDQTEHYLRCEALLSKHGFYIDQSVMGSGKTYVALALAQSAGLELMVIGPKSSLAMWEEKAAEYHVPLHTKLSYQMLTGMGKGQPKHGLLTKSSHKDDHGNETVVYAPSPLWVEKVAQTQGLLVIVDEAHNCKNPGNKERAVAALLHEIRAAYRKGGRSAYFGLLSASLMDKQPMAIQFLRVLGFYTKRALTDNLHNTRPGYDEIVKACMEIAQRDTLALAYPPAIHVTPHALHENVYQLFTNAVLPATSSSMPDPILPANMKNVYYPVENPVLKQRLMRSYADLVDAVRFDPRKETVAMNSNSIGAVNSACREHEWALAEVVLRDAWAWLKARPTGKVIIFTNYKRTLHFVQEHLAASGVKSVPYEGNMSSAKRVASVRAFQNDPKTRAFVSNIACGGVSISLHDLVGNQPRLVLIFPTYKILDVYQATGRAVRRGMKTPAEVRMVYSADHPMIQVFNALARKTDVLKEVNKGASTKMRRKYPGEFPAVHEKLQEGIAAGGEFCQKWHERQASFPHQDKFKEVQEAPESEEETSDAEE